MRSTFLMIAPYEQGMTRSHLMGLLDLGQRLRARGHRVLVYTEGSARAEVEAAGAELVPHQRYRELGARMREAYDSLPRWMRRGGPLWWARTLYVGWRFRRDVLLSALDFAAELEPLLLRERVDCVVQDFLVYGAGYAAERLGLPAVSLSNVGMAMDAQGLPLQWRKSAVGRLLGRVPWLVHAVMDRVLPLKRVRRTLGLPPRAARHAELFQTMASPRLHLVTLHPRFVEDIPLRGHQLFVGPVSTEALAPPATTPPPTLVPDTVLVSTTTVGGDGGLLRRVLSALAPLGRPVLANANPHTEVPPGLGAHVRVETFVPHEQVLPHVAAVVTHGGAGMVGRALRHGVPMLMIPLFAEQPFIARVAQAQGLAYHLPLAQATPEAIRERLLALLADRPLHERLARLAPEVKALCAQALDVEALEHLAREGAERHGALAAAQR
jgi:UDP:flavonoid glycosyltransferase YjiC (YdhE family)